MLVHTQQEYVGLAFAAQVERPFPCFHLPTHVHSSLRTRELDDPTIVTPGIGKSLSRMEASSPISSDAPSPPLTGPGGQHPSTLGRSRWKMESEDSSYDSDYENSEALSPRDPADSVSSTSSSVFHDEVSRTVSDTLAAEYADYIDGEDGHGKKDQLEAILLEPNYTSRVEFALKLGYTEQQVQIALHKLGPHPGQNELLAELIKLGASARSCGSGGSSASSVDPLSPTHGTVGGDGNGVSESGLSHGPIDGTVGGGATEGQRTDGSADEGGQHLRPIVVDGSNVAMSHGNKDVFSCLGIKLCIEWFKGRGHKEITVFVPKWRKEASRPETRISDQDILLELEKERCLVFTPSRLVGGRRLVCYDDRYILKLAAENDGIVVSNDNYRDLASENPDFKKVVEERLLMYSFVNDRFMPPDDPLGRHGPNLENFLRKQPKLPESLPPPCPYGKKCTYGNKCKYYHPERGNLPQKSVTERLSEQAKIQIQEVKARGNKSRDSSPGDSLKPKLTGTVSAPASCEGKPPVRKTPLSRTRSVAPGSTFLPRELMEETVRGSSAEDAMHKDEKQTPLDPGKSCPSPSDSVQGLGTHPAPSTYQQQPGSWAPGLPHGMQSPWTHPGMMAGMRSVTPTPTGPGTLFYSDHGGHLSVAKRLSDPENKPDADGANLHRKLQRQLTLNPTYDPRLFQLPGYHPHMNVMASQQHSIGRPLQVENQEGAMGALTGHRPLARHCSATDGSAMNVLPHMWNKAGGGAGGGREGSAHHPCATRIASAPDSYCQWPPSHGRNPPMQRLNSTSDTQLNLFHDAMSAAYVAGNEAYDPSEQSNPMWALHVRPTGTANLQPRWSPHDPPPPMAMPRAQTPVGHLGGVSMTMGPRSPPGGTGSVNVPSGKDVRSHVFCTLASIFPLEQVQAAMMMYPDETNPQKICATIVSMFPPKGQ